MIPPVSFADLLRACRWLKPNDDRDRQAIAAILGFSVGDFQNPTALPPPPEKRTAKSESGEDKPLKAERRAARGQPMSLPSANQPGADFTLTGPEEDAGMTASWLSATDDVPSEEAERTFTEPVTLFEPKMTRAILSTALGIQAQVGRVDVPAIIEEMARARPLRGLPRLPAAKIAPSVQILMDVSDSMMPFANDARLLIPEVKRVAGPECVRVLKFADCPLDGAGTDGDETWPDYTMPAAGTYVLLVTDFGIGRPPLTGARSSLNKWIELAARFRRRKVPCTALVPYSAERLPRRLLRLFRIIEWDRSTTAGKVKFARRPALR